MDADLRRAIERAVSANDQLVLDLEALRDLHLTGNHPLDVNRCLTCHWLRYLLSQQRTVPTAIRSLHEARP